jgi:predicted kinase
MAHRCPYKSTRAIVGQCCSASVVCPQQVSQRLPGAADLGAAFVRIDTIEAAIARAEGCFEGTNDWEVPPGYLVGYEVTADQLRNGLDVAAESVNLSRASRDAWRATGLDAGAHVVEVEVVCSDTTEHRRRTEERVLDVPGLTRPTWAEIRGREYDSWDRDPLVVDTAMLDVDHSVQFVRRAVRY